MVPMNAQYEDRMSTVQAGTPWQIWVVIALLAVEGAGNLLAMAATPIAGMWLAFKVLTITGLLRKWRIIFVLFSAVAALHVLAFAADAPFIAFLNLLILLLVMSQYSRFFPPRRSKASHNNFHGITTR